MSVPCLTEPLWDLSSPTVSTSAALTVLAISAHEKRKVAVVDITGAYLNADTGKEMTVRMRLDQLISGKPVHNEREPGDDRGAVCGADQ